MASPYITNSTTYAGKETIDFYSAILKQGNTKANIRIMPGVKTKVLIPRLDFTGLLQAADCTYTDGGTTTLSQKTLSVVPMKINKTFCQTDFDTLFLSEWAKSGSNTGEATPAEFLSYAMDLIGKNVSSDMENVFWNGTTGLTASSNPLNLANGALKAFDADVAVIGLTAAALGATSQIGLTSGNIIAALKKTAESIPAQLRGNPELRIYMSATDLFYYKEAQAAANTAAYSYVDDKQASFFGIPIVESAWIPVGRIVITHVSNLWQGCDLDSDDQTFKILPQYDVTGEPTVRIVMQFKWGFNYGVSEEIVSAKYGTN